MAQVVEAAQVHQNPVGIELRGTVAVERRSFGEKERDFGSARKDPQIHWSHQGEATNHQKTGQRHRGKNNLSYCLKITKKGLISSIAINETFLIEFKKTV